MLEQLLAKIRPTHIFNIFALILILISLVMGKIYKETQEEIIEINKAATIEYLEGLSRNLKLDITRVVQKDFVNALADNTIAKAYIVSNLKLFITSKYQAISLIAQSSRNSNSFVSLATTKRQINYTEVEKREYERALKLQKSSYFKKSVEKNMGVYVSPIILDGKAEALLVVEFSLEDQDSIFLILNSLGNLFSIVFGFFIFLFISVVWFSLLDKRREQQKRSVFEELQRSNAILNETTSKLKLESQKIKYLNDNLERRVRDEVEKNRAKDVQLLHQARLAQMGEMLSMIAHQWRQPLNTISATSSALKLKVKLGKVDDDAIVYTVDNILGYVQHLSDTIDDFRSFFKPNKEKMQTNYRELVESVDKLVHIALANKNIDFIKEVECEEELFTYPNELKHVILNLIKNAEDALLENKIAHPFIRIYTYCDAKSAILEVSDNGGGIDEGIMEKIFDPYFSTKLEKDGTGLGLYMSKMIIEEHCGGTIEAKNNQDGVTFTIILGKNNV